MRTHNHYLGWYYRGEAIVLTDLEIRRSIAIALLELGVPQRRTAELTHVGVGWVNSKVNKLGIPKLRRGAKPSRDLWSSR